MQIRPKTWVELSVLYRLGIDPLDPHDNILAGTAYLREMHDRFGSPGFLAAYNAGPERYQQHLASGRPLPAETQAYLAALAPVIDLEQQQHRGSSVTSRVVPWRQAPLFVEQLESTPVNGRSAPALHFKFPSDVSSTARRPVLAPRADGLFVRGLNEMQRR
jgi:Transglycosylase SLT domain